MERMEIPNLDDIPLEDLVEYRDLFRKLYKYCNHKVEARCFRKEGIIDVAIAAEARAEEIYRVLPDWARW